MGGTRTVVAHCRHEAGAPIAQHSVALTRWHGAIITTMTTYGAPVARFAVRRRVGTFEVSVGWRRYLPAAGQYALRGWSVVLLAAG